MVQPGSVTRVSPYSNPGLSRVSMMSSGSPVLPDSSADPVDASPPSELSVPSSATTPVLSPVLSSAGAPVLASEVSSAPPVVPSVPSGSPVVPAELSSSPASEVELLEVSSVVLVEAVLDPVVLVLLDDDVVGSPPVLESSVTAPPSSPHPTARRGHPTRLTRTLQLIDSTMTDSFERIHLHSSAFHERAATDARHPQTHGPTCCRTAARSFQPALPNHHEILDATNGGVLHGLTIR